MLSKPPIYDVPAEGYDQLYGREQLEKYELIALNLRKLLTDVKNVLDVGCATSLFGEYLHAVGYDGLYIGIDVDLDRLKIAKSKLGERLMLIQADAHNLPIRDRAVDFAACITVIHLLDVEKALMELFRVSKKLMAITLLKKRLDLKPKLLKIFSSMSRSWSLKYLSVHRVKDEIFILEKVKEECRL